MKTELKLSTEFTSDGEKFFYHQEAMQKLRDGKVPGPISGHLMICDICNHSCSFCSTLTREGDTLPFETINDYLDILVPLGLKSCIISGGGNPILFKDKESGADFNDVVNLCADKGLEVGLITNGMPMKQYPCGRNSWKTVKPETLDKLKWCRISMSGLDHPEREVYIPDFDKSKTTLGFSYVLADTYYDPLEKNHGKVSTLIDLGTHKAAAVEYGIDRLPWLQDQFAHYVNKYDPAYLRLLPNCLEPGKIMERVDLLNKVADAVNPNIAFTQVKLPKSPQVCYLGFVHPVLNCDGWVFPCDSVVLAAAEVGVGHQFADNWRMCRWDKIGDIYNGKLKSLVDSQKYCQGCVFTRQNEILEAVSQGMETPLPTKMPQHVNFI